MIAARNRDKFLNYFLEIDWASIVYNQSDENSAHSNFLAALLAKYETSFPLVKISRKMAKNKKWVTPEIIKASSRKNSSYKNGKNRSHHLIKKNIKLVLNYLINPYLAHRICTTIVYLTPMLFQQKFVERN